jgi:Icc-related predicted phosphoesterase
VDLTLQPGARAERRIDVPIRAERSQRPERPPAELPIEFPTPPLRTEQAPPIQKRKRSLKPSNHFEVSRTAAGTRVRWTPLGAVPQGKLRIAVASDIHTKVDHSENVRRLIDGVLDSGAKALLLCGDLCDHGAPDEARVLADHLRRLTEAGVAVVAVLGNHDHTGEKGEEVKQILQGAGVRILDGESVALDDRVAIVGVRGFGGGFDRYQQGVFGEAVNKAWVQEGVDEAEKLKTALEDAARPIKIAISHYAPIQETVRGEPVAIQSFLGTSRLAEKVDADDVLAYFHGHAHAGKLEGRTKGGTPVFNVAQPVLQKSVGGGAVFADV